MGRLLDRLVEVSDEAKRVSGDRRRGAALEKWRIS
jgi:hypothetical protein